MFEFTNDCLIGHEELDQDHRKMFELLNRGIYVLQDEYILDKYDYIKDIFSELLDYSNTHFAREEAYMVKIRDAELIMQRVQHNHFRNELWKIVGRNIDEFEDQIEVLNDTLNFLTEWLYQHIIASDTMIGKLPPLEEWMMKEDIFEFSEEYLIGNELIDREHKELFRLIGKVNDLVRDGVDASQCDEILKILEELKDYTKFHFSDEEEYMESIHYEGLEAQKRAHRAFVYKLEGIEKKEIEEQPQKYMQSLVEFLLGWLINHILYTDKKIPT